MSGTVEVTSNGHAPRRDASQSPRLGSGKFRPKTAWPPLWSQPALYDRLTAGAGTLTVLVGSAGVGKACCCRAGRAAEPPDTTSWLSCDNADANRSASGPVSIQCPPGGGARNVGTDAPTGSRWTGVSQPMSSRSIVNDGHSVPAGRRSWSTISRRRPAGVGGPCHTRSGRSVASRPPIWCGHRIDPPLRLNSSVSGESASFSTVSCFLPGRSRQPAGEPLSASSRSC